MKEGMNEQSGKRRSNTAKNSRRKGHNLERIIASTFRDFGFDKSVTSRAASKLLDDNGIDIAASGLDIGKLPMAIQCKMGYPKNRPKFEIEYNKIKPFLDSYDLDDVPIVLIHKIDGKKPEHWQWTFKHDDIIKILKDYYEYQKIKNDTIKK